MIKVSWRSLRFQIMAITVVLLLIPVLLLLYDLIFATKSEEAMISSLEERLGSLLHKQVVPGLEQALQKRLQEERFIDLDPENQASYLQASFEEVTRPLVPNYPGVRFGLYLPDHKQIFVQGFLHEYRQLSPQESRERERRILNEADSGLMAVVASQRPLARLTTSLNDETFEYLTPVIIDGKLVAVAWVDERLHPIFAQSRYFRLISRYVTLFVFFACTGGVLFLVHNLVRSVNQIKEGLGHLEKDLNHLLPDLPGEAGQIARAINRMARSIAEKEKLEEQLHRSERLAALGRLVTGIAHELRNPISVVKTIIQVMEQDLKGIPDIKQYTDIIKEQIDRQNRIIQELLDFGRPAKNFVHPASVNSLLDKVLTFTTPLLREHQVQLNVEKDPHIPLIEVDGERIKQVFVNLILNAVQVMPEGGRLTIKTYAGNNRVCIQFSDTGPGIASEDISRIFDPFYTTRKDGTGLGLSISHQIVASHGGNIDVTSSEKGATFTVCLPIMDPTGGQANHGTNNSNH
ncbi:integral membrane sensor signal transduction histidine kinase [Desulfofundulus kuznetsovii DSM 6115]|uniref:histidine kinase n=1 Tax=Desulfofundulus kuznetsovii (strain DSM 6115 / VKM B-1805 / 17) TaxID=760568 RepID=A0AAU8PDA7_DESK7|nr:integral membrane sensor signal transduction histidine kinase [Desulfofundulus kuznetsovii DSM 6115]